MSGNAKHRYAEGENTHNRRDKVTPLVESGRVDKQFGLKG
jgi:hypothetical protein